MPSNYLHKVTVGGVDVTSYLYSYRVLDKRDDEFSSLIWMF